MEELGAMWSYEEGVDELKQKLLYANIEIQTLKLEANEEMRKHKEEVKQLLNLLKMAYQERDEAKEQLQNLLNNLMPSSPTDLHPLLPHLLPESSLTIPMKANSSISESNSFSDAYNHHSHGSSPVDSFLDAAAVTSPEFSSINMADSCRHMGIVNSGSLSTGFASPAPVKIDPADAVIDSLLKANDLPQEGGFLQRVMEAGPLLQTLLLAGPLPEWRNPPPVKQFKIPPVSINGSETANVANKKPAANSTRSAQTCSASMINFANGVHDFGLGNGWRLSSAAINQTPDGKRRKYH